MNQNGIARFEHKFLAFESCLQVARGDLVIVRQDRHTFRSSYVEQNGSCHEHADILHTELRKTVARRNIVEPEAVIEAVTDSLMAERIELSADLTHLAMDHFFVA